MPVGPVKAPTAVEMVAGEGEAPGGLEQRAPLPPVRVSRDMLRSFPHSKRVGSYLVGKMINKGSFAKVMEGLHIGTGEKVAIKVIDKKKARQDSYVLKNMKREPRIHQMVRHPHIVVLFETLETENSYYMAMELCAGGDLMDRICERKRLEEREVRRYTRQILSAVDHLHKHGVLSATSSRRAAFLHCLRWGVWSPLQPPVSEGPEGEITVALRGGPEPNPHNVMVYTPHTHQQQQEVDTISFSFCSGQDRKTAQFRSERAHERSSQPRRSSTSRSPAHGRRAQLDSPPDSPPGQGLSLSQLAASSRYPSITHFGRASPWQPASLLHQSPLATAHQLPYVMSSMAHLEVDLDPGAALRLDEDHLQETAYTPVHAPVLHLGTSTSGPYLGSTRSRGALAQLSAAGFPPVLDCTGQPAHTLDTEDPLSFDPHREETDLLQGDLLLLQFLAFTRSPQSAGGPHWPRSVYLTFQLYRFPPVTTHPLVLLEPPQSGGPFCLLTPVTRDGPSSGPPGLQLQFRVDSSFLRPGERPWFLQYLASHSLQLDVWDSDSLLLVGSAAFPLKIMLRQGKPAVQALHELDVLTTEYVGEELLGTGGGQGPNCPLSVHTVLKGQLHVRTGNMGCPTPPDQQTPLATPPSHVVMPGEVSGGFRGGSVCARGGNSARAQRLQSELPIRADLTKAQQSQDGRRKLSCMAAVHRREGSQHAHTPQLTESAVSSPGVELRKAEAITLMLSRAITTEHWLFCSLGSAHFLEYVLRNPFTTAHTVTISSDQPELSVITNPEEWQYFRSLKSDSSPVEKNMFHLQPGALGPQIYLRPLENLHIPFKYQSFECDHNCSTHGPSVAPSGGGSQLVQRNRAHVAVSRTIKVTFSTEDSKPLSILQLNIQVTPPIVDQSFRLYHPEQSFLKKAIRLPTWDPPPGGDLEVTVRCSDRDVVCQSWKMMPGEPQDVYVKVPGSPSPHVRMFFILVYTDRWKAAPSQVWQVYVHFLERVDISAVSGQRSCQSLVLRGKHTTRKLRCFSSHPQDLKVDPGDVFALPPAAVQEVQVSVQPWRAGRRFFYLSGVDVEQHRLVSSWLLCLTVHQPIISKAFELCMPVGEGRGSSRKISYTNPYSGPRTLLLRSDQPHLLQFKEERFQVGGGETYTIGLRFAPSQRPGAVEILVFVNDLQEKTEEAFCVKALYS
uniref:Protein kinase domain-containing protein n=1 Tax=Knipowitschia caucasica TaxID=637954 RepID=A0AAV2M0Z1_KNICA